jgi:hypothetical protein
MTIALDRQRSTPIGRNELRRNEHDGQRRSSRNRMEELDVSLAITLSTFASKGIPDCPPTAKCDNSVA